MSKLTRRSIIAAATLPALAVATGAEAVASPSPLADLIREYRALRAVYEQADEADERAAFVSKVLLWAPGGRAVYCREPIYAHSHEDIDAYFDRLAAGPSGHDHEPERVARHAELAELESSPENREAKECAELANAAYERMAEAREGIFACRPQNMVEVDEKNAFLRELLAFGHDFADDDLGAIFGSVAAFHKTV